MTDLTTHARLIVGSVTFSLIVSLTPLLGAQPSSASSPLCNKVSPAEVSSFLAVKATKVSADVNGSATVCWYRVGANPQAAFVRVQTGDTKAGFTIDKKSAATQGEKPKTDSNFGSAPAFSTSLGSASYGYTFSVTVLKKTTELVVGGVTAKLSNVEGLTKKVLPLV